MREKFVVVAAVAAFATVGLLGGLVLAQEGSDSKGEEAVKGIEVSVSGTNYCVGCTLGKSGAASQCSAVGHIHALKVKEAKTADGEVLKGLNGETLHYLYNVLGKEYTQGHHGEELTLHGTLYKSERILDLGKASAAGSAEGSDEKNS